MVVFVIFFTYGFINIWSRTMKIKCCSFKEMSDDIICNNKTIIMFGAGAIGITTSLDILSSYNLCSHIDCYIDNDSRLWKQEIDTSSGNYSIKSPEYLEKCIPDKTVILLNISRYAEIIEQLKQMHCTDNMLCYIMPMMCIHNFSVCDNHGVIKKYNDFVIPKIIHYMWLGGKNLPENLQKCVDSWKRYCPDYEIKCWNESNYDINKNLYMKQAYENKAYGFVPDYARLDILYNYGGIYLDTDIELIRNLDELLYQDAFCSVEKWQLVNFGGCSGAVKGNKYLKKLISFRDTLTFVNEDGSLNRNTCGYYDTYFAVNNGYIINGKNQTIEDITIYASDYFHPYDYMSGECRITENTFSIHHFNGGWLTEEQKLENIKTVSNYNLLYQSAINTNKKFRMTK